MSLKQAAVYHRLKASRVYDADQRLLQGLPRRGLIFDIGANHGAKTDVFLRLGARVVAVDPDETNQEIDTAGHSSMWVDSPDSAKNTLSQKWVDTLLRR